jgi:hypothetical protein
MFGLARYFPWSISGSMASHVEIWEGASHREGVAHERKKGTRRNEKSRDGYKLCLTLLTLCFKKINQHIDTDLSFILSGRDENAEFRTLWRPDAISYRPTLVRDSHRGPIAEGVDPYADSLQAVLMYTRYGYRSDTGRWHHPRRPLPLHSPSSPPATPYRENDHPPSSAPPSSFEFESHLLTGVEEGCPCSPRWRSPTRSGRRFRRKIARDSMAMETPVGFTDLLLR